MDADRLTIRPATRADVPLLLEMIAELAAYEKLGERAVGDVERLERSLFELRAAEALIAEVGGEPAGYAIFFPTFSTFLCWPGLWIEDIYVRPGRRGEGLGRALFGAVAATATERGFERLDWAVLDWNETAISFYRRLGAIGLDEWRMMRLEGEALIDAGRMLD